MTEQRTFPEELLAAADLSVLECSTLLLLRRRTLSGNVPQDTVALCVEGESEEGGDSTDHIDNREERKGKKNKKKKTDENENENEKETSITDSSRNISHNSENVPENILDTDGLISKEDSIEAVAGRLCSLIVKSVALLITFTAEKQANVRTYSTYDVRAEMSCTYEPYIGMKRVLTQLQRASSLEMNLSREQWDVLLWQPLARTMDSLTHRHMLKHIILEDFTQLAACEGEGEGAEDEDEDEIEECGLGLGETEGEDEENPNPADDDNENENEVEESSVTINDKIEAITQILPVLKSPTVVPLSQTGWSSVQSVIDEDQFWEVIDQLKEAGAEGILVCAIEKMVV